MIKSIELFVEIKCDIIICATRTRGATCNIVKEQENNYSINWINKGKSEKGKEDEANLKIAEIIIDEIEKILA